jgi:hypothetical protein
MVYGICRPQSGYRPLYKLGTLAIEGHGSQTYPAVPSLPVIVEIPLNVPVANGGIVVCMRTLTASNGQRPISAKNSAEALAAK